VGRVLSNCADHGDQVYLVPYSVYNWLSLFALDTVGSLQTYSASPDLMAEYKEGRKEQ